MLTPEEVQMFNLKYDALIAEVSNPEVKAVLEDNRGHIIKVVDIVKKQQEELERFTNDAIARHIIKALGIEKEITKEANDGSTT